MKYTDILWDFNGTILDDVEIGIESANVLLRARGLPVMKGIEDYHRVFGFPIIDYYRRLGISFENERYEDIAPVWVAEYERRFPGAGLRRGAVSLLDACMSAGIGQTVISATEAAMLGRQINMLGIGGYFRCVCGLGDIHASSKLGIAVKWRSDNPAARALFIGDTVHDAEAAEAINADCVLISGGHQPRRALEACGCPVADSFDEIKNMLFFQK